ncbi:MAG: poly-gamma-glutamate system protein [bacterium]|nr:poly-gamma-glutamate system protein [bacterium]
MTRSLCLTLILLWCAPPLGAQPQRHPAYDLMIEAAAKMQLAELSLYERKRELGLYDEQLDPGRSGVIGVEYSRITTTLGYPKAKRSAANPDFAAYILRELMDHGIGAGDSVLVAMSGSFPGMNLAVLFALETLDVWSFRISSLGASSYGANQEEFTWLDMEDHLVRSGLLARRSNLVSLGGTGDVGGGLPPGGRTILRQKAEHLGYPILSGSSLRRQTKKRRELAGDPHDYHLLINIGGNQAMLGKGPLGRQLPGGWIEPDQNPWPAPNGDDLSGIIFDFLTAGVPVLNLLHIEDIATAAGIPFDPQTLPEIGTSPVYFLTPAAPRR